MVANQERSELTKHRLLCTAERLFALEGIDAVSTRRISQEAGQRNNSALQYHFGSREALIEALVASRMSPINERRRALLDAALKETPSLGRLVAVLVVPFVEQLLDGEHGAHYARFVGQFFARGEAEAVLGPLRPWNEAFYAAVERIALLLSQLPEVVLARRLRFLAGHMVQATSAFELELRGLEAGARRAAVRDFAAELVDYTTGALSAPREACAAPVFPGEDVEEAS